MKIAILGGNGFLGTNICRVLSDRADLISIDIRITENKIDNVKYIVADCFAEQTLDEAVSVCDVIIHSLGLLNPSNSNQEYKNAYVKEIAMMISLCEIVTKYGKKLIFISSGGTVYGDNYREPIKETYSTAPMNHYGNLKLCLENVINTFVRQNGMKAAIARVANPYGVGQDFRRGVGFIDAAIRKGIAKETLDIWGDGETVRDYIYIDDVCNMIYALCNESTTDYVYNISTGVGTSQNRIVEIISSILGPINVRYLNGRSVDAKVSILNNERILGIYHHDLVRIDEGIGLYINDIKSEKRLI